MAPSLVEKYERILQADPRSRIFVELARALLDAGDAERATEVCQRGLEHHPDSVQARVVWGRALLTLGRTEDALARFEEAVAADAANPYGYALVGEALVRNGLAERALPLMQKGVALHPGDGRIRRWLVEARRAVAERPEADTPSVDVPEVKAGSAVAPLPDPLDRAGEAVAVSSPRSWPRQAQPGVGSRGEGNGTVDPQLADPLPASRGERAPIAALPAEGGAGHTGEGEPMPALPGEEAGGDLASQSAAGESEGSLAPEIAGGEETTTEPSPSDQVPGCPPRPRATPPPLRIDSRTPPPVPRADPGNRGAAAPASVLDLIPDAPSAAPPEQARPAAPTAVETAAPKDEESEAEAAALTYEHELREKFRSEPPPRPSFIRRHALATAAVAIALALAAAGGIFVTVRTSRRADEARAAVEAARKGLARDTVGALREAARVVAGALRLAPASADAAALQAEVSGLLAHDFEDADARSRARELLASGRAGEGALAARWLVAEPGAESAAAATALLDHAAEGTPLARALAGEILLARHDRDGARSQLEAAAHSNPPLLRALSALGDLDLDRGDTEAALERYSLVLRAHPTHPHAALGAAEARLRLGRDLPEALRVLEAVDADRESTPSVGDRLRMDLLLARLLAALGRTTDAERRLAEAAARRPAQAEIAAAQAEVFARAGEIDRAIRSAEGAARLAPSDVGHRELLARLQLRRGRYRELLAASEAAPSRTLRLYRGIARFELGQLDQARAELEGTRREGRMLSEAAGWMALVELAAGRRAHASAIIGALLAVPSPHPLALLARGRLDLAEGHTDAAEQRFREAAERDPDLPEARCDLGRVLLRRGRPAEARTVLEKAVARNPFFLDARLELGRARLASGDAAGAVRELETVTAERPQDVSAWIALSSAQLAAGSPAEARRAAERGLAVAPRSAGAALAAGKAAAAQGAAVEARRLLERAAKLAGKTPEAAEARRALAFLKRR